MLLPIFSIILTFSIVVFVHELGHFLMAIKAGVKVETFSLGFGPEIMGITFRGIRFKLSVIPLGGYVKMKGENPEEKDARESDAFMGLDPIKRIGILMAGPGMNFIAAMLIFSMVVYFTGLSKFIDKPIIGGIAADSPAYQAGLKKGDRIVSVNGGEVSTWQDLTMLIGKNNETSVQLQIERDGEYIFIEIIPKMNEEIGRALIGITASFENIKLGLLGSFWEGFTYTLLLCLKMLESLWLMLTGKMAAAIAGPVGIAKIVTSAAGEGISNLFQLIAFISINLGIINLFPIPVLDGGHILFAVLEKIKGSPLDAKKINLANLIGLSLIITLLVFATWQDIIRNFFK